MARDRQTQVNLSRHIDISATPLKGGAITVKDKGQLKPGQFSMVQNVIPGNPGFQKRRGQRKLNTGAYGGGTPYQLKSAYQFKKTRVTEDLFLVQASDGVVLEVPAIPPAGAIPAAVGSASFTGTTAPKPASWANLNDMLVFSNAVDQHKLYPGKLSYVKKFVVYTTGAADLNATLSILEDGNDYTDEVTDAQSTTVGLLNSLGDEGTAHDGFYICTPVPAQSFTFTLTNFNGTASTLKGYYWKNDNTWADASITDGTKTGGNTTMGQSGTVSFTAPAAIQERFLFGAVGYWYLFTVSVALDATVSVQSITYDAPWASLVSMWDAVPVMCPTVMVEGASTYDTYSGDSVDIDTLEAGKLIYIYSLDPVEGIYLDPGSTPQLVATTINTLKYWNGAAWTTVGTAQDGTTGLANAGWVTFPRCPAKPCALQSNKLYGYWYEIAFVGAISADVIISVYTMPYFDIHDWGYTGQCSAVWKERALYTFSDKWQEYVYISASDNPQILTGDDSGIIEVGDGRPHKVVAMKNFFNNMLVYQEEKGTAGGCITMLQGYDVPTFGKLVLSTKIGTMNAKSVDVVENVYTATATDESLKTVAFSLSRYGVCACDGTSIGIISGDIQNYFDPNDTANCIRHGYEDQMWLKHDPVDHVLRLGLVCGATATTPNVFPVYDLVSRCWYFDVRAQELAFWESVDAASGNAPFVQIGGGTDDGFLYQVNYGTADVTTAIDSYVTIELNGLGLFLDVLWFVVQCKAQTGTLTLYTYQNGVLKDTVAFDMAAEVATEEVRRHLQSLNIISQHVSLKLDNSSTTESMSLYAVGLEAKLWRNR